MMMLAQDDKPKNADLFDCAQGRLLGTESAPQDDKLGIKAGSSFAIAFAPAALGMTSFYE
jgi:hypothetical protein